MEINFPKKNFVFQSQINGTAYLHLYTIHNKTLWYKIYTPHTPTHFSIKKFRNQEIFRNKARVPCAACSRIGEQGLF